MFILQKKDLYSGLAKYSDLRKKQYNYNKKKSQESEDTSSDLYKCSHHTVTIDGDGHTDILKFSPDTCRNSEYYLITKHNSCDYLYAN